MLPRFPKKKLWGSMKPERVMKRSLKIEQYLRAVVTHPELIHFEPVRNMLNLEGYLQKRSIGLDGKIQIKFLNEFSNFCVFSH